MINQVDEAADLSLVQTASSDSTIAGEEITYTLTITNNGAHNAQGVQLAYTLPEGATFISANINPTEQNDSNLSFDLGDLADEESTTLEIAINVSSVVEESFGNVEIISNTYDPYKDNNLTNASNSAIADTSVVGTIIDDDSKTGDEIARGSTVYRFYNPDAGVHFYTADEGERNYVRDNLDNYTFEGESYVTVDHLTGSDAQAVYRFFNSTTGVHLYTTDENERDYIIDNLSNFTYEDITFYAYESEAEDTIPIYRFYEPNIGVHFYTPNLGEKNFVEENLTNYTYEGIAYYAYSIEELESDI